MDIKEIKEIVKLIDSSSITEFELEKESFKISIKKGQPEIRNVDYQYTVPIVQGNLGGKSIECEKNSNDIKKEEKDIYLVKSPIVGTFYSSPGPDKEAFVKAGDKVKKGDVLCIIEAMKLMNEVTSDVDGEIAEVLAEDKSIVEYGQPLFKVRQV